MKIGAVSESLAHQQHKDFSQCLKDAGAHVVRLPFIHGSSDSVFMKDSALLVNLSRGPLALISKPRHHSRQKEPIVRAQELAALGFNPIQVPFSFEGGDLVVHPSGRRAYLGYGFRSEPRAAEHLSQILQIPVTPLKLMNPHFYHLDVAFNLIQENISGYRRNFLFAFKGAFRESDWDSILNDPNIDEVIEVKREEAQNFSLNWVEVNDRVILGASAPRIERLLKALGKKILITPLDQFHLAGGSAACLSARVHFVESKSSQIQMGPHDHANH